MASASCDDCGGGGKLYSPLLERDVVCRRCWGTGELNPKVTVQLEGTEEPDLDIGRVTQINSDNMTGRIYFEEMKDGKWRLTYTGSTIPDIRRLTALRFRRGNNG